MERIKRNEYLDWMIRWRNQQMIKVVSGVRRCGKSTLFAIYQDWLLDNGVNPRQIIAINFESIEYEHLTGYRVLYDYITSLLLPDQMNYIFLDEIQHVDQFEKAVDSLFIKENCDIFITGSNGYFMSGDLATLLSGRYVELKMLPLSFAEFCLGLQINKNQDGGFQSGSIPNRDLPNSEFQSGSIPNSELKTNAQRFNAYVKLSSFPYALRLPSTGREVKEYLTDLYNTILLKDVMTRQRIADVTSLEQVTKFLLHNIGSRVSPGKIANTMKSAGKSIDQKTVDKYIRGLTDSLLFYEATRYNIKGRQYLNTQSKYYAVDVTLRNTLVQGSASDIGHILENVVYLELLRRGNRIYVGDLDDGEVDFVAVDSGKPTYYQVAASTLDEGVLMRELAPLQKIPDNYPKLLLTLDEVFATADYEGIQKRNLLEWLLDT